MRAILEMKDMTRNLATREEKINSERFGQDLALVGVDVKLILLSIEADGMDWPNSKYFD